MDRKFKKIENEKLKEQLYELQQKYNRLDYRFHDVANELLTELCNVKYWKDMYELAHQEIASLEEDKADLDEVLKSTQLKLSRLTARMERESGDLYGQAEYWRKKWKAVTENCGFSMASINEEIRRAEKWLEENKN